MSAALWGTVVGALSGNYPCDKYGRKVTLVIIGVLYLVSALGSACAFDPYTFAILRFIGGLGVGISSIMVPAYIAEIAPAKHRGRLVALYQFQIVFGILVAFLSNYLISDISDFDWRIMLGVEAIPALIYLLMIIKAPESPRWLILHGNNIPQAKHVLHDLGESQSEQFIDDVLASAKQQNTTRLFSKKHTFPLQLLFAYFFVPETKGKSLEYLSTKLFKHNKDSH